MNKMPDERTLDEFASDCLDAHDFGTLEYRLAENYLRFQSERAAMAAEVERLRGALRESFKKGIGVADETKRLETIKLWHEAARIIADMGE